MVDKGSNIKSKLPSRHVSVGPKSAPHRSMYYAMGMTEEQIYQPFIGVATTWNESAPFNITLARQAQSVKIGGYVINRCLMSLPKPRLHFEKLRDSFPQVKPEILRDIPALKLGHNSDEVDIILGISEFWKIYLHKTYISGSVGISSTKLGNTLSGNLAKLESPKKDRTDRVDRNNKNMVKAVCVLK